jgi:hypothetical protein
MDVFIALEEKEPAPYMYFHGKNIISRGEVEKMPQEDGPEMYGHLSKLSKITRFGDYFVYGEDVHICYSQGNFRKYLNYNLDSNTTTSVVFYFDDMLFKPQMTMWLPEFGCSTKDGIYKYLNTEILSMVCEDSRNEVLALDKDNLNILKTVLPESNPVIIYYDYRE